MSRVIRSFQRYALQEYIEQILKPVVGIIRFPELHIHGTWKPTISDFRKRGGEYLMQAMYRAHLQRGFSDIAQHATIDPDGYIWAGRSLFTPPASATGFNDSDNDRVHPFMFEMIGNFDTGCEMLAGPQLATAAGLSCAVMDLFGAVPHLHREFTNQKTCPGSGIQKEWFLAQVAACGREVKPKMDPKDAQKIETIMQTLWQLDVRNMGGTALDRDEIHRLTNEVRKAGGLPLQ